MASIAHTGNENLTDSHGIDGRDVVYVASPMACYITTRYDRMLEHARRAFPRSELLSARDLYRNTEHWQATWPVHLARLTALLFFADADGTVGWGVWQEVQDALARGIPVQYLRDDGDLIPHGRAKLTVIDGGMSWRRYARVQVPLPPKPTPRRAARSKTSRKMSWALPVKGTADHG